MNGGDGAVWRWPTAVTRVVDGDTLCGYADLGARIHLSVTVRVLGIDCPEMSTAAGKAARVVVDGLCPPGSRVVVISRKLDSFGRVLGDVLLPDGRDLGALLLEAGHAVPYGGGRQ